jgi:hypothetical protein
MTRAVARANRGTHLTPADALGIAAQVAVALAGFTGIVVVFGSTTVHQWRPLDKLRLRLLLTMSTLPLGLSLLAILLLATGLADNTIWRVMSALSAAVFAIAGFLVQREFRRLGTSEVKRLPSSRIVFYLTGLTGAAVVILMIYNCFTSGAFWPFFAGLICSMMAAVLQFVRLIALHPGRNTI